MSSYPNSPDYSGVTETPGTLVSRYASSMAMSRYDLVRRLATGRRVLEVACGSGQGLGYVAVTAQKVFGGDISASLLFKARDHYQGRVPLTRFDAHIIPFKNESFDLVEVHEAIYYMRDFRQVFFECRRVLRPGGVLVVSSINPQWSDFNPSPQSTKYLNALELKSALEEEFATVDVRFGFPVRTNAAVDRALSWAKRTAVRLGLIPKTMRGKTLLKRIFLGRLVAVPPELTSEFAVVEEPISAPLELADSFRILYAIATCD